MRSFALVFSQSYEMKPDPGLLGEYKLLDKNGPRHVVKSAREEDMMMYVSMVVGDKMTVKKISY